MFLEVHEFSVLFTIFITYFKNFQFLYPFDQVSWLIFYITGKFFLISPGWHSLPIKRSHFPFLSFIWLWTHDFLRSFFIKLKWLRSLKKLKVTTNRMDQGASMRRQQLVGVQRTDGARTFRATMLARNPHSFIVMALTTIFLQST